MTDRRQTLLGVSGFMLLAIIIFTAGPLLVSGGAMVPERLPERIFSGSWVAIAQTARNYSRLPPERRLSPPHAIGLGGLQLVLIAWLIVVAPAATIRPWLVVVAPALLAIPGVYLMVMGTRAVRADVLAGNR